MSIPTTLPPPETLLNLSRNLGGIWMVLMRGIGAWSNREQAAPLPLLARTRAARLVARLQAILALLAAGRLPRAYAPRPPPRAAPATSVPKLRVPRLPRKVGWLMGRTLDINVAASNLRAWLADPATRTVLAEVPQARRPLAALCRMLAIPPWPLPSDGPLPPPKPRVRKPRPRKIRRPTLAEDRAAVWHHRSLEVDHGLRSRTRRPWWLPSKRE